MPDRGFAVIGLWRPKCAANVGGVLRAARCFGAAGVIIAGERFKRARDLAVALDMAADIDALTESVVGLRRRAEDAPRGRRRIGEARA